MQISHSPSHSRVENGEKRSLDFPSKAAGGSTIASAVKKAAQACLGELCATLAIYSLTCSFAKAPSTIRFFISCAKIQLIANYLLEIRKQILIEKNETSHNQIFDSLSAILFWLGSGCNLQTLIHEAGHALAALCCFQSARPKITLGEFSGLTRYYATHLRGIGLWLGDAGADIFVAAAGPALSLSVSCILLKQALQLPKKEAKTTMYLSLIAWGDFCRHSCYALSALIVSETTLSHDFVFLSLYGLHPIAAAVGIIAIPILITACSRTPLPIESEY